MDKFDLLCLIEAISNFAYDIHYTAKGRNFYSDHLFSERLADVDIKDDFIETFYLGESQEAPDSAKISAKVAEITPKPTNTPDDFKKLRKMIVKALMAIENYHGTKGEEDLLGSLAHILQRHNGLLYRELSYTPEEIKNDNDEWERLVTGDEVLGGQLNNEKWITVHPNKENPDDYRRLKVEDGETSKEAVEDLDNNNKKEETKEKDEEKKDIIEKTKETIKSFYEPETIAGALKGEPMERKKANSGNVNPKYGQGNGYETNCQSCVVAYEARLRGYDVEVLPNTKGSPLEELSKKPNEAWLDMETGDYAKTDILTSSTPKGIYEEIDKKISEGQRFILSYFEDFMPNGHTLCVGKDNKGLYIYDAQDGNTVYNDDIYTYLNFFVLDNDKKSPWITRIDDKAFNPEYYNSIMKKKD